MAITPDQSRQDLGLNGLNRTLYISLLGTAAMATIAAGSVCGSYVNIAAASGYACGTLVGTSWGASSAGGTSTFLNGTTTWTFTGSVGNVQGYCISTAVAGTFAAPQGTLVAIETFSAAQMVSANGDKINVIPTIKLV